MPVTDDLVVNLEFNTATRGGLCIRLEPREAALLFAIQKHWPATITYEQMHRANWGLHESESDNWISILKVRVSCIRKKIRPLNVKIENTYGMGYRLELT